MDRQDVNLPCFRVDHNFPIAQGSHSNTFRLGFLTNQLFGNRINVSEWSWKAPLEWKRPRLRKNWGKLLGSPRKNKKFWNRIDENAVGPPKCELTNKQFYWRMQRVSWGSGQHSCSKSYGSTFQTKIENNALLLIGARIHRCRYVQKCPNKFARSQGCAYRQDHVEIWFTYAFRIFNATYRNNVHLCQKRYDSQQLADRGYPDISPN